MSSNFIERINYQIKQFSDLNQDLSGHRIKFTNLLPFICAFTLINNLQLMGQSNYQPNKIIPPSPTAASLGQYGEIQTSYYTGTSQVDIPLYQIKTNNHQLDIKLDYSGTANRVAQDASWVGLGWSLSSGGLVTRSIRGKDDFISGGYYYAPALPACDENNDYAIGSATSTSQRQSEAQYFADVKSGLIDGEPDIFYYNFSDISGKFTIGKNADGHPVFVSNSNNLDIKFDPFQNGKWTITDERGYKYIFSVVEKTKEYISYSDVTTMKGLNSFPVAEDEIISAWYLERIVAPNTEEITFSYEDGVSLGLFNKSHKRYDFLQYYNLCSGASLSNYYSYRYTSRAVNYDKYLKRIDYKNGYLIFNRTDREDIEPHPLITTLPAKLSEIVIYNKQDELLKRLVLSYGYFNDYTTDNSYSTKRLKLNSVTEYGSDGTAKKPFTLEYINSNNMLDKYSNMIDNWGFPVNNGYTNLPTITGETTPSILDEVLVPNSVIPGNKYFKGAKRTPDKTGAFITSGMLASITYPTGGSTSFQYEPHDYSNLTSEESYESNPAPIVSAFSDTNNQTYQLSTSFTLTETTVVSFTPYAYVNDEPETLTNEIFGYLKNSSNQVIEMFNRTNGEIVKTLSAGQYSISVDVVSNYYTAINASYEIKTSVNSKIGGGLRIKYVRNYDDDGELIKAKRFIYTQDGTSDGMSSGRLVPVTINHYYPIVGNFIFHIIEGQTVIYVPCYSDGLYLMRYSSTLSPLGFSSQGNTIGYDKVTVLEGENGEGGRTEYDYYNDVDFLTNFPTYPGLPTISHPLNGKLKNIFVKDNFDNLLKKSIYAYELKERATLKGIKIYKPEPEPGDQLYTLNYVKYYDNASEWWVNSSSTEETYSNAILSSKTTQYYYTNPSHKLLTSQAESQSDGSYISTVYKYPVDFISQQPYEEMVNVKHIISPIIETTVFKNANLLTTTKTNYAKWGDVFAPVSLEFAKGFLPKEERMQYSAYDASGNILSQNKQFHSPVSYIWGHNNTLPIAEVVNSGYDRIAFTSFENDQDKGNWAYSNNSTGNARTGKWAHLLTGFPISKLLNSGKYKLEFWSNAQVTVSGGTVNRLDYSDPDPNGWSLSHYEVDLSQNTSIQISASDSNVKIDEVRLYPLGAAMSSYTYNDFSLITSATDQNCIITQYEYDGHGRLKLVKDKTGSILKAFKYHYKQ